jgi:hypothetical protein
MEGTLMAPTSPPLVPELPVDLDDEDQVSGIEQVWIARLEAQAPEVNQLHAEFFAELRRRKARGLE